MSQIRNLLTGGLSGWILAVPLVLLLVLPGSAAAKAHRTIGGGSLEGDPLDSNDLSSGGGGTLDDPVIDDPYSSWDSVLRTPIVLNDGVLFVYIANAGSPLVSVQLVFLPATVEELHAD